MLAKEKNWRWTIVRGSPCALGFIIAKINFFRAIILKNYGYDFVIVIEPSGNIFRKLLLLLLALFISSIDFGTRRTINQEERTNWERNEDRQQRH